MNLSHRVAMYRITHTYYKPGHKSVSVQGPEGQVRLQCCLAKGRQGELLRRGVVLLEIFSRQVKSLKRTQPGQEAPGSRLGTWLAVGILISLILINNCRRQALSFLTC